MAESTGLKTKFAMDSSSGTSTIVGVAGITPPQPTREMADVDELDPTDEIKRKLPGLIDMGEATLTLNYDPAAHSAISTAFYSATKQKCKITYPGGGTSSFDAYISGFAPQEITAGGVMQAEITLTVVSKVT